MNIGVVRGRVCDGEWELGATKRLNLDPDAIEGAFNESIRMRTRADMRKASKLLTARSLLLTDLLAAYTELEPVINAVIDSKDAEWFPRSRAQAQA